VECNLSFYQLLDDYDIDRKMSIRQVASSRRWGRFLRGLAAQIEEKATFFEAYVKALLESEDVSCRSEGPGEDAVCSSVDNIAPSCTENDKKKNCKKPRVSCETDMTENEATRNGPSIGVAFPNSTARDRNLDSKMEYLQVLMGLGCQPPLPRVSKTAL
jgi:hypothetical protein